MNSGSTENEVIYLIEKYDGRSKIEGLQFYGSVNSASGNEISQRASYLISNYLNEDEEGELL